MRRGEIELTGPQLGVGGWATVTVAKFRGAVVAIKRIHNQIVSPHNIQLFQREMNMVTRLRHPNLSISWGHHGGRDDDRDGVDVYQLAKPTPE